MKIRYLFFAFIFLGSAVVHAQGQGSNSSGQDRPEKSQMPRQSENMPMQHDQEMHQDEEHMQDMSMDREHMDEQATEERQERMPKDAADMGKQKREEHARGPDLESQQEKRGEDDRTEAGRGSEQGQASREENSRKWWRFWE